MSSNTSEIPASGLPNPFTPLAWIPPDVAHVVVVCQLLLAGVCGAWIWDYIISISEEYIMIVKHKIRFPDIVYFLSRITTCTLLTTTLIFLTGPLPNIDCQKLVEALEWCGAFAMPLNSLLFFFRVRAVFYDSPRIIFAFGLLWLSTVASISSVFASKAVRIGNTNVCEDVSENDLASIGFILLAVHDTIVYLAIGFRLIKANSGFCQTELTNTPVTGTVRSTVRAFFTGAGMGRLSKALLKSSQLFYLATVGVNFALLVITFVPSTPPGYRATLKIINIVLQNAMTCRVFRRIKIGHQNNTSIPNSKPALPLPPAHFKLAPCPGPRIHVYHRTSLSQYMPTEDRDRSRLGDEVDPMKQDIIHLKSLGNIESARHTLDTLTKPDLSYSYIKSMPFGNPCGQGK